MARQVWQMCTSCSGLGYHIKENRNGTRYNQQCSQCAGKGGKYVTI